MSDAPLYRLTYLKDSLEPTEIKNTYYHCSYIHDASQEIAKKTYTKGGLSHHNTESFKVPFYQNDTHILLLRLKDLTASNKQTKCYVDSIQVQFLIDHTIQVDMVYSNKEQQTCKFSINQPTQTIQKLEGGLVATFQAIFIDTVSRHKTPKEDIVWKLYTEFYRIKSYELQQGSIASQNYVRDRILQRQVFVPPKKTKPIIPYSFPGTPTRQPIEQSRAEGFQPAFVRKQTSPVTLLPPPAALFNNNTPDETQTLPVTNEVQLQKPSRAKPPPTPALSQVKQNEFTPPYFASKVEEVFGFHSLSLKLQRYVQNNSSTIHSFPMSIVDGYKSTEGDAISNYMFSELLFGFMVPFRVTINVPDRYSNYTEYFFVVTINSNKTTITVLDYSEYDNIRQSMLANTCKLYFVYDNNPGGAKMHLRIECTTYNYNYIVENILTIYKRLLLNDLRSKIKTLHVDHFSKTGIPMNQVNSFQKVVLKIHKIDDTFYFDCGGDIIISFSYFQFMRSSTAHKNVLMIIWHNNEIKAYDTSHTIGPINFQTTMNYGKFITVYAVNHNITLVEVKIGKVVKYFGYNNGIFILENKDDFFGNVVKYDNALVYLKVREPLRFFQKDEISFYDKLKVYDKQFTNYVHDTTTLNFDSDISYKNELFEVTLDMFEVSRTDRKLVFTDKQLVTNNQLSSNKIDFSGPHLTNIYYASFNGEAKFHSVIMLAIKDVGTYVCVFENDTKIYGGRRKAVIIE
jgi:hypothetical protein